MGLKFGDLDHTIKPYIAIDRYSSKIDDERCVVVGFYVTDIEAAKDLNRFIQKSYIRILDTDISPSPNRNGDYMVFVELKRNKYFSVNLKNLLTDISGLTSIEKWSYWASGDLTLKDLDYDKILDIIEIKEKITEEIHQGFKDSYLNSIKFDGSTIEFNNELITEYIEHGDINDIMNRYHIETTPININETRHEKLSYMLGESWEVISSGNVIIMAKDDFGLVIR